LHGVTCLVLWRVAHDITGRRDAALVAAALFATTFSHWEAVMWLAGGTAQILASLFVLLSVTALSRWVNGESRVALTAAWLFAVCAMLTKETGVVAVPLLGVFLVWGTADGVSTTQQNGARWPLARIARWVLPLAAALAAYLAFEAFGFRFQRLIKPGV